MKILREKIFFDYKGYAEKYGLEAAKKLQKYRNKAAGAVRSARRSAQSDLSFVRGISKNQNVISETKAQGQKSVNRTLKDLKNWLSERQADHAKEIGL